MIDLESLVNEYAENKKLEQNFTKLCKKQNTEIKKAMTDNNLTQVDTDKYTLNYTTSVRESFDEDKLIALLHKINAQGIIKQKEYVDMDALENAIYNGIIDNNALLEMDKCKLQKEVVTLRISKHKNKDN